MELNAKQIIKELEGLAGFTTCPEYIKNALALIKELTEENERLQANNKQLVNDNAELKNQNQEEIAEEDINLFDEFTKLLHEGIREAKADTVRKMQERLKMYFGTYILGYKIPLNEVLKVINQIAKEMLEGKDENS